MDKKKLKGLIEDAKITATEINAFTHLMRANPDFKDRMKRLRELSVELKSQLGQIEAEANNKSFWSFW